MRSDPRYKIGNRGEELIVSIIENAIRSDCWWDSEKDGIILKEMYEVKTIRLNRKTQCFWQSGNLIKLDNVDRLYIVRVPMETEPLSVCTLYVVEDHRTCWHTERRNDGVEVRAYPLSSCKKICDIDENHAKFLQQNSNKISVWK